LRIFEQEATCSCTQGGVDVFVEVEGRQHDDACSAERWIRGDGGSCADPVSTRHPDVHENDIGTLSPDDCQSGVPVSRRPDHLDVRV
jgi:hypothetical protein